MPENIELDLKEGFTILSAPVLPKPLLVLSRDGEVVFNDANGQEALRLSTDGDFFVRGAWALNDMEICQTFRTWLRTALTFTAPMHS